MKPGTKSPLGSNKHAPGCNNLSFADAFARAKATHGLTDDDREAFHIGAVYAAKFASHYATTIAYEAGMNSDNIARGYEHAYELRAATLGKSMNHQQLHEMTLAILVGFAARNIEALESATGKPHDHYAHGGGSYAHDNPN
jgi:hypothetical protein